MIQVSAVCKEYHSETRKLHHRVLSDISFSMDRGEKIAVLGRNGAGKSTLIRLIARIYNKPFQQLREYVDDFAELGKFLAEPVRTYSAGMRARLNFALSVAIDFDCYLIDELIAVGDQRFQRRSHEELFEKRADRSLILASHVPYVIKEYCSRALVLHRGRGKVFDDLDLALDIYNDL